MPDTSASPARRLAIPTIAAAIALAILLKLGFWQVDRLAEKEALIARVAQDVTRSPEPAPGPGQWPDMINRTDSDYRHVSVSGHYLSGTAYYYVSLPNANGSFEGPGYMAYSPFETEQGWRLMINRGFVPQGLIADDVTRVEQAPAGTLDLTGLLRMSEKPNWTTPDADTEKRIWFARDTEHMAHVLGAGTEKLAPYSIDLDASFTGQEGLPQAGETVVRFKNDHLGYALTWFGLAATLVGVYLAYAVSLFRKQDN